jgi:hypothetical protein
MPNYDWIKEQIDYAAEKGRPVSAAKFEECLRLLQAKDEELKTLRRDKANLKKKYDRLLKKESK